MTTNREFFEGLAAGYYVKALCNFRVDGDQYGRYLIDAGRQYIWAGRYKVATGGGRTHAVLVEADGQNIRHAELDKPVQFERAWRDVGGKRTTDYELFLLHCLINACDSDEQIKARIDALTSEVGEWKADNVALSQALNTWATEQGYEDEFDREVEGWNKGFARIRLGPREFEYETRGKLTVTYDIPLKVTATTADKAEDQLSELDAEELWNRHRRDVYPQYDIEWEYPTRS